MEGRNAMHRSLSQWCGGADGGGTTNTMYILMYVVVRLHDRHPLVGSSRLPMLLRPFVRLAAVRLAAGHAGRGCLRCGFRSTCTTIVCFATRQASQRLDFSSKVGSKTALGPVWMMLKSFWGPPLYSLGPY